MLTLLAGCGGKAVKPSAPAAEPAADAPRAAAAARPATASEGIPPACLQVREHRDEDYTPGGLYAPAVRDTAPEHPLDISNIPEPVPRDEPPAAYGNRSPYTVLGKSYRVLPSARGYKERGIASWYGQKFHGRQTSSREIYDMCSFSAAHKTLPLPSYVRVTNLDNGRSAVVRVNDRGPFHAGRIIDLSYAAAIKLGVDRTGTAKVEVVALSGGAEISGAAVAATTSAPPLGSGRPQIVQVGAYRERDNARRIASRLEQAGVRDVRVEDVRIDGGRVWRVRVGPMAPRAVQDVVERIEGLGLPSPRIFSE
jgi:rare lipoprotein A